WPLQIPKCPKAIHVSTILSANQLRIGTMPVGLSERPSGMALIGFASPITAITAITRDYGDLAESRRDVTTCSRGRKSTGWKNRSLPYARGRAQPKAKRATKSRSRCPLPHVFQNSNQLPHLFRAEDSLNTLRAEIRKRRLIQLPRIHPSALGQVFNHLIHKLNLGGIQCFAAQKHI